MMSKDQPDVSNVTSEGPHGRDMIEQIVALLSHGSGHAVPNATVLPLHVELEFGIMDLEDLLSGAQELPAYSGTAVLVSAQAGSDPVTDSASGEPVMAGSVDLSGVKIIFGGDPTDL